MEKPTYDQRMVNTTIVSNTPIQIKLTLNARWSAVCTSFVIRLTIFPLEWVPIDPMDNRTIYPMSKTVRKKIKFYHSDLTKYQSIVSTTKMHAFKKTLSISQLSKNRHQPRKETIEHSPKCHFSQCHIWTRHKITNKTS
jgi:hypothetical protein